MDRDLVGWAMVGSGLLDLAIAFLVLAPRLPADKRRVVVGAMVVSSALLVSLGGCFLGHVF